MPFQDIARAIDWYRHDLPRPIKSLIYSGLLYGGLNELGDSICNSSGMPSLDTLIDMTSTLATRTYLADRLETQLTTSRRKELIMAGIAAYVGADLAYEFTGEHWNYVIEGAKNLYLNLSGMVPILNQLIANGIINHRIAAVITGLSMGGLIGAISRTTHHVRELSAARALRHPPP